MFTGAVKAIAHSGPWDTFNYAPASKAVYPTKVHSTSGFVQNPDRLIKSSSLSNPTDDSVQGEDGEGVSGQTTIIGGGSWVALDFGIEVSYRFPYSISYPVVYLMGANARV